jgi:hypothetical protein
MKTLRIILIASFLLFQIPVSNAQDNANQVLYLIHEDIVNVGKSEEYHKAGKDLAELVAGTNFTDMAFSAFQLDDYTFMYASPIENMARLDEPPWNKISEKAGKENFESVMAAFDGTYDTHRDFIAVFHPDLSYKPEQVQEEGHNYRSWMYFYYNQINQQEVMDLVKEWKQLYEDHQIDRGYSVFTNGFGHEGPVLVVHSWATSPADYAMMVEKRNEKFGDKGRELWERTEKLAYRIDNKTGWFLPELSYVPQE